MTEPSLRRKRALARAVLWWEAAWPAAWPALGVVGVFAVLALLGLPALVPGWLHLVALLVWLGALGWAGWRGWTSFRLPDAAATDRRLERATGLSHRPLATLQDRPATADPAGLALWSAHQARMRRMIGRLRVGFPRPGLAALDPRALRGGLLVALAATLVMAGADAPALLARGLTPSFAATPPPAPLRYEAWVTPPNYTGAPPIFLPAGGGTATVPAGSRLQVAISGGGSSAVPEISGAPGLAFEALGGGSHTAQATLSAGARIAIQREGRELVAWNLAVQADAPPIAAFTEAPARAQRGLAMRVPWRAEDDWGVVALRAEFRLAARPDAAPVTLDMTLPSAAPRQARGLAQPDLSAHPWAGLAVVLRLVARDGAGQEGTSEEAQIELPERSFNHPVARAMIEVRKGLSLDPEARRPAMRELERLTNEPQAFEHDSGTLLALRTTRGQLQRDRRPEAVAEVQELLWEAALALEEGRDSRTARALAEAQRQLREALDEAERNPQDEQQRSEVERRIEELREAIRRHLEAMAERLQRENAEALPYDPQQRMLDQRDMDRRTRRMEEAARQNRMEEARRELAELEEMLRALQEGRVARGESPERQRQRERGQQQMGAVQDMVRRQGEMVDQGQRRAEQSEQRAQQQRRQQQQSPWNRPQADPGQQQAEREAQQGARDDARRQRALRRALGELMQQQGDLTGEVPEALGRADQAMREAQEALGNGTDARPHQQEAMRRLQEGGRQMAQQMQRQFGQGQGEGEGEGDEDGPGDMEMGGEGDGQQQLGEGRDPLGRRGRENTGNADNGSDTRVPEEAELLRTRRLQEELRRRGAERERPSEELDYIDRLLRRF
ncbi:TIGR02302 family protein [Roseococcus sp. SYP-B2431]|uniref:TIGR02302 family protein n=1 Tax=Roseococcus sp. SYP-B2431 TaxID=2496640 RepID=UPI00103DCF8D|nr:TIGR02302 family protein [Roseococcus sp. SYP-B2431]TCH99053.1 TIGR02302 family protein [Roseococcus sp. SYP-B2431]